MLGEGRIKPDRLFRQPRRKPESGSFQGLQSTAGMTTGRHQLKNLRTRLATICSDLPKKLAVKSQSGFLHHHIPTFMVNGQRQKGGQIHYEAGRPTDHGQVATNSRLNEPETDSFHNRASPVRNLEGVEEVLQVILYRSQAAVQLCTDVFIAEAVGQQEKQFALHRAD